VSLVVQGGCERTVGLLAELAAGFATLAWHVRMQY
jgi:hypothetical protein